MLSLDATTRAEYEAQTSADARAAVVLAALVAPVYVKVYNGSGDVMGSGTLQTPWATRSSATLTIGEVSSFSVATSGTPDANWYLRFESGSRYVQGSFGLSGRDFNWSLASWTAGQAGTIGTASVVAQYTPPTSAGFTPQPGYSVSGTFTDGATITITGSGFGTKPNGAKPLYYFDFAGGTLAKNATYSRSVLTLPFDSGNEYSEALGVPSVRLNHAASTNSHGPRDADVGAERWYVFRKRYTAFDIVADKLPPNGSFPSGTFNWKTCRLWPTSTPSGLPDVFAGYQGAEGLASGRMYYESFNENPTIGSRYFGIPQAPDVWERVEWYGEPSTIDAYDAKVRYVVNGKLAHDPSARWRTRSTALPSICRYLYFDQVSNGTDAGPNYTYSTNIYIDDSWCRVLHSDETAFTESTSNTSTRKLAIPSAWSDTEITVTLTEDMSSGERLYVVKSDGTAVLIGVKQ